MAVAATTSIQKTAKKVTPGFGIPFLNDYAAATNSQPTTDNTAASLSTATLTNAVNSGWVHVQIDGVDSAVKIASVLVTVGDGTNTQSIGGYNPAAADQTAGNSVELLFPFISQLAVNVATAKVTPSGTKGGSIEYSLNLEI